MAKLPLKIKRSIVNSNVNSYNHFSRLCHFKHQHINKVRIRNKKTMYMVHIFQKLISKLI
jgi:hypothetical protein